MNFQPPEQDDPRDDDDREQARDWSKIESFVDEYIDGYEMIGESEDGRDACYTPNANDRALLRDCIAGLLAEQAFIEMLSTSQIQPPQDERGQWAPWLEVDDIDEMADRYGDHDKANDCYSFNREGRHSVRALVAEVMRRAPNSSSATQQVALTGRAAIVDAWNNLPSEIRQNPRSPELDALYSAIRACDDATPPQPVAAEVAEDTQRLDWLDARGYAYGFEDMHEGNRWLIEGPYRTIRIAIDDAMAGTGSDESKENGK